MTKSKPEEPVKFQIPVSRELADELARWAQEMEWTQGRLASVMLEFGSEDRARIVRWIAKRIDECIKPGAGPGWLQKGDNSAVRLQIVVDAKVALRLERLAVALNQTSVRVAALLIDFALCDERWVMNLMKSRFGKALRKLFGRRFDKYESAEIVENDTDGKD